MRSRALGAAARACGYQSLGEYSKLSLLEFGLLRQGRRRLSFLRDGYKMRGMTEATLQDAEMVALCFACYHDIDKKTAVACSVPVLCVLFSMRPLPRAMYR